MKHFLGLSIIFYIFFATHSMNNKLRPNSIKYPEFINEWSVIDSLLQKGLIEDALVELDSINELAIRKYNYPQTYKTLLYIEKISAVKDELYLAGVIKRLESKLAKLDPITKSMIQSILGTLYLNINNNKRYNVSKSELVYSEQDSLDIETWSNEKIGRTANNYILESLNAPSLKEEFSTDYQAVLSNTENIDLCPTLYEILLLRAIEHFSNSQTALTDFDGILSLKNQFKPVNDFLKMDSLKNHVLLLYQTWLKHLQGHKNEKAFINANLKRLQYEFQIYNNESATEQYYNALKEFYHSYDYSSNSEFILVDLIKLVYNSSDFKIYKNKNNFQIVDSLCNQGLKFAKDSQCIQYMNGAKSQIRVKTLTIEQEKIIPSKEYSKIKLSFSNLNTLYFKLYKVPFTGLKDLQLPFSEIKKSQLTQFNLLKTWKEEWKNIDDFKQHSIELKIDPLELGRYYIVASNNVDIDLSEVKSAGFFLVSNIATFQIADAGKASEIIVVDRKKGNPIAKANVFCFQAKRENYAEPAKLLLKEKKITDKNGIVNIASNEFLQYYVTNGKDIYTDESGIAQAYGFRESEYYEYSFYLDRSIYRPGQTVYFKAYAIQRTQSNSYPNILTNKAFTVTLRNSNYQEIGSLKLKTNEFGTAHGSFVLPKTGLNGTFQLETSHGSHGFQVEDYKRPGFEIVFDTLNKSYSLNDEVEIKGKVISYNKIPLAAKLKYTVQRQNFFPWMDYSFKGISSFENLIQIDNGSIESNDKGEFSIKFKAKESSDIQLKKSIQQFAIKVDATDQNQETQSNTFQLQLSHKKLYIQSDLKPFVGNSKDSFHINVKNIAGNNVQASLHIRVSELESPNRYLKKRLWEAPDIQLYSYKEFNKYFPNDVFANEDEIKNWKESKLIFEKSYPSGVEFDQKLAEMNLKDGFYSIWILAKDSYGNEDSLNLFTNSAELNSHFNATQPSLYCASNSVEPGETVDYFPMVIHQDYFFYYRLSSKASSMSSWQHVEKLSPLHYKIKEEDRGGIVFSGIGIFQNRVYEFNHSLEIPWSNKKLQIESKSFRDKLLPGQNEEWTFKITNSQKSKEKFEVLASMYDQSLDQILAHQWNFDIFPRYYNRYSFQHNTVAVFSWNNINYNDRIDYLLSYALPLPSLNDFEIIADNQLAYGGGRPILMDAVESRSAGAPPSENSKSRMQSKDKVTQVDTQEGGINSEQPVKQVAAPENGNAPLLFRKNLNETVFFYPQIYSDDKGNVTLKFAMNEAMTKWKLQILAHSIDLKFGTSIKEVITQKPLQIKPYYPRYFRQGDKIQLSAIISNLSEVKQEGVSSLQILDAQTLKDISKDFKLNEQPKNFNIKNLESTSIQWQIDIDPEETRTLLLRWFANGTNHSDGEEIVIPVVSNKKLITESIPLPVKGNQIKSFAFESLKNFNANGSKPFQFSLEFSSHPVWNVIQVLPYMMEFPFECAEQLMTRIYANAIGTEIMKRYPKVAQTLKLLLSQGLTDSKLLQNQELKSALIEETPWILDAQTESEQLKRIALLMDFNTMESDLKSAIFKLRQKQNQDGSFSWFPGSYPDRYMTQHIVIQISHLKKLKINSNYLTELEEMAIKARGFLDYIVKKEYEDLATEVKEKKRSWEDNNLNANLIHYYYCKSLFSDWNNDPKLKSVDNYYLGQMENFWLKFSLYEQGLTSVIAHRNSKENLAQLILKSLKQRSIYSEELGRYWKNSWSYYWTQMPIETQALMIELFSEVAREPKTVDELKTWLLKNKQTQHWGTTKATSEAVFAMLAFGDNYTEENLPVRIELGNQLLDLKSHQAADGYYKNTWSKSEIKPEFSRIKVENPNKSIAWGAAYYQYFQDLDKVELSNMKELILNKELYIKSSTKKGSELKTLSELSKIKTGDVVTARIIIKADRSMDYVHLKVMRASGLEPIQQLSGYQYKNGLGYYISPRDLATDFFISYLPKGTYVLEYDMRASFKGTFSDGISTLQCMYAPEFSAHSKGIRIIIE